jgi:hypothetical protein
MYTSAWLEVVGLVLTVVLGLLVAVGVAVSGRVS